MPYMSRSFIGTEHVRINYSIWVEEGGDMGESVQEQARKSPRLKSGANILMTCYFRWNLYGEAFATGAGAAGVGVVKVKPFAIQPFRKLQGGIEKV